MSNAQRMSPLQLNQWVVERWLRFTILRERSTWERRWRHITKATPPAQRPCLSASHSVEWKQLRWRNERMHFNVRRIVNMAISLASWPVNGKADHCQQTDNGRLYVIINSLQQVGTQIASLLSKTLQVDRHVMRQFATRRLGLFSLAREWLTNADDVVNVHRINEKKKLTNFFPEEHCNSGSTLQNLNLKQLIKWMKERKTEKFSVKNDMKI